MRVNQASASTGYVKQAYRFRIPIDCSLSASAVYRKRASPLSAGTDPDSCALHRTNRKPPDRQKDWRRHNRHPIAAAQDEIRISPRCLRNPPLELRFSQHIVFEGDRRSLHITGIARIAAASAAGAVLIYGSVAMFCFSLYMLPPSPVF
ncbi:hypothetical protein [Megasphaera vaginalis (ex Bordigoni et al. 2020)]|uniref:hypothetical protein n=1 Tax=Megasphaera vaginalis (ex Bordigoni et al. 2020) TaxID=2045301 RepID=UPI0011AF15E2|nr:hypothetical protein [Megasphaera vaginalis (ex Bordigoni et al. 2020)]